MSRGRYLRISAARRIVADIMHFSVNRPLIPIEREMNLAALVEARSRVPGSRPGWCAIFVEAYSVLSSHLPELRRAYVPYPWERLFECEYPVAAIAVERELEGEPAVLPGVLKSPQVLTLLQIEEFLTRCKTGPFDGVTSLRRAVRYLHWPRFLRRWLWAYGLNWRGSKRGDYFGTFGVSVTAGMGAATLALLSPLTTTLHYGRFDESGRLPVRITFDHHVLDAGVVARAMVRLEEILNGEVLAELRGLGEKSEAA